MKLVERSDDLAVAECRVPVALIGLIMACSLFVPSIAQDQTRDRDFVVTVEGVAKIAPISAACFSSDLEFSGWLYSRVSIRKKLLVLDAEFIAQNGWDDPQVGRLSLDENGRFQVTLSVWDHTYSTRKPGKTESVKGRSVVTISAPGCRSKRIKVDHKWRPRPIVLRCPDR